MANKRREEHKRMVKQIFLICVIALNAISIIIAIRKDVIHGAVTWVLGALISLIINCVP
ncbi:hypothetical protein QMP26_33315 [Enterocloster clostridioformis]